MSRIMYILRTLTFSATQLTTMHVQYLYYSGMWPGL